MNKLSNIKKRNSRAFSFFELGHSWNARLIWGHVTNFQVQSASRIPFINKFQKKSLTTSTHGNEIIETNWQRSWIFRTADDFRPLWWLTNLHAWTDKKHAGSQPCPMNDQDGSSIGIIKRESVFVRAQEREALKNRETLSPYRFFVK